MSILSIYNADKVLNKFHLSRFKKINSIQFNVYIFQGFFTFMMVLLTMDCRSRYQSAMHGSTNSSCQLASLIAPFLKFLSSFFHQRSCFPSVYSSKLKSHFRETIDSFYLFNIFEIFISMYTLNKVRV